MTIHGNDLTAPVAEPRLPVVDRDTFRSVMGSFVSGVTVVTTLDGDGRPRGFTCSSVCSVSMSPPLLLASANARSSTLRAIVERGTFAVNFLNGRARTVSQLFASMTDDQFEQVPWSKGETTGMPVLAANVAHAECELDQVVRAGDHDLLLGRMAGGRALQDQAPLAYWRGGYVDLLH
ncbi:flavin reductase family protein [Streptomyces sp. NPDC050704]|uniref:flavin reductase family protein n=1 Tax=Streptomyces sp. NPDC050704 TaxID=3157219 RepID=UPI00342E5293